MGQLICSPWASHAQPGGYKHPVRILVWRTLGNGEGDPANHDNPLLWGYMSLAYCPPTGSCMVLPWQTF